ncbi:MAG: RecQ family ATP-dependent DNA helicase [Clostridiales bacterium]|nr:RecQ family ATP-dependent DNA helicase [Clostridiales bacterium]
MDKLATLKHYFGHDGFRAGQEPLVDALLQGRDCLGIMPTGAGKSMCYQIPALMKTGVALVISPLISLMKDQVSALKSAGVPAAYLNSSLTPAQMDLATERARMGMYRIIYVAPERLETASFQQFARSAPISLIAVDEAHCVSQWGQDFRPNYLKIADFVESLPVRPAVGAFTATATARVRDDIIRLLRLRDPAMTSTGFDRPNLYFEVVRPKSKYPALSAILRTKKEQSGIVYCATRKAVEEVCDKLTAEGFTAGRYHAGLSDEERRASQEDFQYDRVQVMVATNAFGMGIDKSNVNYVIHYNMPRSMEAYYQEAGRAGRDGTDAECILLYNGSDIYTAKWMIEHGEPNPELSSDEQEAVRRQDLRRLETMITYSTGNHCLRQYILRYFGQSAKDTCDGCSHCVGAQYDYVEELKRPSRKKSVNRSSVFVQPAQPSLPKLPAADPDNLYEQLRACRLKLAQGLRVPPYIICDDKTLADMARRMPHNLDEMLSVHGMGTAKVGKWGNSFLKVINAFAASHPRRSAVTAIAAPSTRPRAWTKQEDQELREGYLNGISILDLSDQHHRSAGAIRSRLAKLGLIFDGEWPE